MPSYHKFAVLTCGGVCPGMNDVVHAITMRSYQKGVQDVHGIRYGFRGLHENTQPIKLTPYNTNHIHLQGGTILGTSRDALKPHKAITTLQYNGYTTLFIIGGNGGNMAGSLLYEAVQRDNVPVQVIGLPKSIDNDIDMIDQCFGFDTAVHELSKFLQVARIEADSVERGVCIVKTMGRNSGFIAYHAKGADIRLIPENPIEEREIVALIKKRIDEGKSTVVCVAEGFPLPTKTLYNLCRHRLHDAYVKYMDPSYLIRGCNTSDFDHEYCTLLGSAAVDAALSGMTGVTIATKNGEVTCFDTKQVIARTKLCKGDWIHLPFKKP